MAWPGVSPAAGYPLGESAVPTPWKWPTNDKGVTLFMVAIASSSQSLYIGNIATNLRIAAAVTASA
jgi:hypothetical protein